MNKKIRILFLSVCTLFIIAFVSGCGLFGDKDDNTELKNAAQATITALTKTDANFKITAVEGSFTDTFYVNGTKAKNEYSSLTDYFEQSGTSFFAYYESDGWEKESITFTDTTYGNTRHRPSLYSTIGGKLIEDQTIVLIELRDLVKDFADYTKSGSKYSIDVRTGGKFEAEISNGLVSVLKYVGTGDDISYTITYGGVAEIIIPQATKNAEIKSAAAATIAELTKADANFKLVVTEDGFTDNFEVNGLSAKNEFETTTLYYEQSGTSFSVYEQNGSVWTKKAYNFISSKYTTLGAKLIYEDTYLFEELEDLLTDNLTYTKNGDIYSTSVAGGGTFSVTIKNGLITAIAFSGTGDDITFTITYGGITVTLPNV